MAKLTVLFLAIGFSVLLMPNRVVAQTQTVSDTAQKVQIQKRETVFSKPEVHEATFIQTFLRTPFAILTSVFTLLGVIATGLFESFGYIFSGFEYKYPVTNEVISLGWGNIVRDWWWHPGVTWHLVVSMLFWVIFLGAGRR